MSNMFCREGLQLNSRAVVMAIATVVTLSLSGCLSSGGGGTSAGVSPSRASTATTNSPVSQAMNGSMYTTGSLVSGTGTALNDIVTGAGDTVASSSVLSNTAGRAARVHVLGADTGGGPNGASAIDLNALSKDSSGKSLVGVNALTQQANNASLLGVNALTKTSSNTALINANALSGNPGLNVNLNPSILSGKAGQLPAHH